MTTAIVLIIIATGATLLYLYRRRSSHTDPVLDKFRTDGFYIAHYKETEDLHSNSTILMLFFLPRWRVYMIELKDTSMAELEEYRKATPTTDRSRFKRIIHV